MESQNEFDPLIVIVSAPQETSAELARKIVESRKAACVNILPRCRSVYHWEGKIEEATEDLLLIKTSRNRLIELQHLVAAAHPYEVPEFIAINPTMVDEKYRAWWSAEIA